jgi:outer membrane protein TolC
MGLSAERRDRLANAQIGVADALYSNVRANALPQLRFNGTYTHVYESAQWPGSGLVVQSAQHPTRCKHEPDADESSRADGWWPAIARRERTCGQSGAVRDELEAARVP